MSMLRFFGFALLTLVLLAACSPAGGGSTNPVKETPFTPPTSYENQVPAPPAATAVQQVLAEQLGVSLDAVKIREIEEKQWSDSCLGAAKPEEMCLQVIVDGFRVVLEVDDANYVFHANIDGTQFRMIDQPAPLGGKNLPAAAIRAREYLSQQIGVGLDQVEVISVIPMKWPDSCLGVEQKDMMCAAMITPGFRIILQVNGEQVVFHTDQEGGAIIQAPGPVEITSTVLEWQKTEDGLCRTLEIGPSGAAYGKCGGPVSQVGLSGGRYDELVTLLGTFSSFEAETAAGSVVFHGQGPQEASEAEQRSIAEWADLLYQESEAGRSGAAWGMAFAWHREGGIAGFCDDFYANRSGWVDLMSCQTGVTSEIKHVRLDTEALAQIYNWVDTYKSFDYEQKDAAQADAMVIRLAFSGTGDQEASVEQQEVIAQFAAMLYARASQ